MDNPLQRVMTTKFPENTNMWERGHFAGEVVNSSFVTNPWSETERSNTPFDQPFYLILNVAVGATNGYFPDEVGEKPWVDHGPAAFQFYQGQWIDEPEDPTDAAAGVDQWYPTWPSGSQLAHRGMTVKSVKMWQQGACP